MDEGTRLALRAILRGLRSSGHVGGHGMTVIVDELRYAAREARDMLFDSEAAQIEGLARDLQAPPSDEVPSQVIQAQPRRNFPVR